jgi:conjugative transfer signal peptidase TraF
MPCKLPTIVLLSAISILFLSIANYSPIQINLTGSMPRGIYLLRSSQAVHRGSFVMVCMPNSLASFALQRGYLQHGSCKNGAQPLLKQVIAEDGDTIVLTAKKIQINGNQLPYTATLSTDHHHRPLPAVLRGIYKLRPHQLWLYGVSSTQSWDSRYYGVIDSSYVIGVVKPLFTNQRGNEQ